MASSGLTGNRCVELTGKPAAQDMEDDSIAYLDKTRLSLSKSYLAAVGRYFGRDTVSGWAMSHGGLLPEEVIIPAVEWFGDRAAMAWPLVSAPDGGTVRRRVLAIHHPPAKWASLAHLRWYNACENHRMRYNRVKSVLSH